MRLAKWLFYVIVCIRWMDITEEGGWITGDELPEPAKVTSCGFFVKENEDFLWLAMDKADDGAYNGVGVWPKGVILSQQPIVLYQSKFKEIDEETKEKTKDGASEQ